MRKEKKPLAIGPARIYVDWVTVQFPGHWLKGKEFQQYRYGQVQLLRRGPVTRLVLREAWLEQFSTPAEAVVWAMFQLAANGVLEPGPTKWLSVLWWLVARGLQFVEDVFDQISLWLDLSEIVVAADVPGFPYAGEFEIENAFRMSCKTSFFSRQDARRYHRQAGSSRCGEGRGRQDSFFSVHVVPHTKSGAGTGFKVKLAFVGKYKRELHLSGLMMPRQDLIDSILPASKRILNKLGVLGAWEVNPLATFVPGTPLAPFLSELGFFGC